MSPKIFIYSDMTPGGLPFSAAVLPRPPPTCQGDEYFLVSVSNSNYLLVTWDYWWYMSPIPTQEAYHEHTGNEPPTQG